VVYVVQSLQCGVADMLDVLHVLLDALHVLHKHVVERRPWNMVGFMIDCRNGRMV